MNSIHVSGIRLTLRVAVHRVEDVIEMDHLDVIVPAVTSYHGVIRSWTKVAGTVGREGDRPIVQPVHVDDVEGRVRHVIISPQW